MNGLFYSPLDIAVIVTLMELDCKYESTILRLIWERENSLIEQEYRDSFKKYILSVRYWMNYLYEKQDIDREFPCVSKDAADSGSNVSKEDFTNDFSNLDLFFKSLRIRLIYTPDTYVRIKLRTLLKRYGYKRRTALLVMHIKNSLEFFGLNVNLKGNVPCDIGTEDIDSSLIFKLK